MRLVISRFCGRKDTHRPPRIRSFDLTVSRTRGFNEKGWAWTGIP